MLPLPIGRLVATSPTVISVAMTMDKQAAFISQKWDFSKRRGGKLTSYRHPARVLERPRQIQNPEDTQANNSPHNGASRAVSQGVEADGPREEMAARDEHLEDDLRPAKDLLEDAAHADGLADDLDGIAEVLDVRVGPAELAQDDARVRRHDAHEKNEDDARHEAYGGQHRWERQDAQGNGLGNEDNTALPVMVPVSMKWSTWRRKREKTRTTR